MGTQVFLGMPPPSVVEWIRKHHIKPETHIKFVDGTEGDYLIEGVMDCPALIAVGLMPPGSGTEQEPSWIKQPLEANIGSAVTSIGNGAFYNCANLMNVMIPDNVINIEVGVFYQCSNLTSVIIPNSVTSIGVGAFWGCSGLKNVTIGNGVTSIGETAFYGCSGLTSVTIPDSVTSIGEGAFGNRSGLMSMTFSGKTIATVQDMENYNWELPSGCVLHCTDGDITI